MQRDRRRRHAHCHRFVAAWLSRIIFANWPLLGERSSLVGDLVAAASRHTCLRMKAFRAASLVALSVLCAIAASEARAQQQPYRPNRFQESEGVWKRMDNCKRQAWKQHPDYTPEGNAKRDQAVRQCLDASNLPPVAPESPAARSGSSRQ